MKELLRIFPLLSIALAACASTQPKTAGNGDLNHSVNTFADTLEAGDYERLFLDSHGRLLRRLEELRPRAALDPAFIEAEAVLRIAEEFFLEGNSIMAVKLLTEAELILGQIPDA